MLSSQLINQSIGILKTVRDTFLVKYGKKLQELVYQGFCLIVTFYTVLYINKNIKILIL